MRFLDRGIDRFVAIAADDLQRPVEIRNRSHLRDVLFLLMLAVFGLALWHHNAGWQDSANWLLGILFVWMLYAQCDSEVRLLKLVETLRKKDP